jgi:hypothetical protein
MATNLYVTAAEIKTNANETESSGSDAWEALASAVSRLFDRECGVVDGFFSEAPAIAVERTYRGNNTEFLRIDPYISGSITDVEIDGRVVTVGGVEYFEKDGFLVFGDDRVLSPSLPSSIMINNNALVAITARWGFPEVPADINQACIEQAIFLWRKKDLAFTELSGVPTAAVIAKLSPSFELAVNAYRGKYGSNSFFA